MNDKPAVIEIRNLRRRFGAREVLQGLSLRVEPGEIYALCGRNGTGKTTAIRILLGFLEPMAGEARILGVRGAELTPELRGKIGFVSEGHQMIRWMKVRDVLAFEKGTRDVFDSAWAEKTRKRLDLPLETGVAKLSRGQRAQLSLLIAMAGNPEVLVMDDPAMGLDAVMRREFLESMIDLLGEEGHSVLFSSHHLSDVERIADRVGILHDGALRLEASMEDLRTSVQRRFVRGAIEEPGEELQQQFPGVLAVQRKRDGLELLCRDLTPQMEAGVQAKLGDLSDPVPASLEDIFIALTARPGERRGDEDRVPMQLSNVTGEGGPQ